MRASLHAHSGSAFQPLEMTYTPCGCQSSYKQRHMLKLTQGRQEAHTWPRALQQAALETEMWRGPEQVLPGLRGAETRMRNEDAATHNLVPLSRVAGGKVFSDNGYLDAFPSARQQQSVRGAQEEREERNRSPGALPEDAQHCRCSGGGALAGRGRSWLVGTLSGPLLTACTVPGMDRARETGRAEARRQGSEGRDRSQ